MHSFQGRKEIKSCRKYGCSQKVSCCVFQDTVGVKIPRDGLTPISIKASRKADCVPKVRFQEENNSKAVVLGLKSGPMDLIIDLSLGIKANQINIEGF